MERIETDGNLVICYLDTDNETYALSFQGNGYIEHMASLVFDYMRSVIKIAHN